MRFLAPLALVVALVGVVVVVQASRPDSTDSARTAGTVETTPRRGARRQVKRKTYVVKAGDNLTVIAERTGVPVDAIQRLNPDLDATALRVGQRLRLR